MSSGEHLKCAPMFLTVFARRRQQTEEPAIPSELGLDLLGEVALCGGRRGQVPGGGSETSGIPGRDLLRQ